MRLYETTFIINPQTDDATIDAQVKAVTDIITSSGGKIVYDNLMGTRRMAYPIKKLTQGYYANFIFEAPKTVVAGIDRHMQLNEAYLRHLTIVYEGQIPDKDAPRMEDDRSFGRPRGGYGDRPHGRREGGRDGFRDRGRPEGTGRRPAGTEPQESKPAAEPVAKATDESATETKVEKPATPEPVVAKETAAETPPPAPPAPTPEPTPAPTAEPTKATEPEPTPEPAAAEPKPEPPIPTPPVAPAEETATEEYREDEEL